MKRRIALCTLFVAAVALLLANALLLLGVGSKRADAQGRTCVGVAVLPPASYAFGAAASPAVVRAWSDGTCEALVVSDASHRWRRIDEHNLLP